MKHTRLFPNISKLDEKTRRSPCPVYTVFRDYYHTSKSASYDIHHGRRIKSNDVGIRQMLSLG